MFTGIIEELGKIEEVKKIKDGVSFFVNAKKISKKISSGKSIAINGVCVTATKVTKSGFNFDIMPETIKMTTFKGLKKGSLVNLESALLLNESIDGHFVSGHVDAEGSVISTNKSKKGVRFGIEYPKQISPYLAYKGSICVNGVSLTISNLNKADFSVDLIPATLKKTNLAFLKKNDKVNLEVDLIARYLKSIFDANK